MYIIYCQTCNAQNSLDLSCGCRTKARTNTTAFFDIRVDLPRHYRLRDGVIRDTLVLLHDVHLHPRVTYVEECIFKGLTSGIR